MPRLFRVDAQRAVADVAILAEHVGVGVVHEVVRVLPRLGRRGEIPFPGGGVDLRIAHPVPLAVQHVVADLHVLEDLRGGERRGAREPGRRQDRDEQQCPSAGFQAPLHRDHLPDVPRVVLAAGGQHLVADLVQFTAELVDVAHGQLFGGRHALLPQVDLDRAGHYRHAGSPFRTNLRLRNRRYRLRRCHGGELFLVPQGLSRDGRFRTDWRHQGRLAGVTSAGTSMAGSVDNGCQLPWKYSWDTASGFSGNLRPRCTTGTLLLQSRSEIISALPPPAEPAGLPDTPKAAPA